MPNYRRLTLVCLIASLVIVICGVAGHAAKIGPPLSVWVALFLLTFGLGKASVAFDKLAMLKHVPSGGEDPRASFASHTLFWFYIGFKCLTFIVAWVVAGYLFAHPTAFTAR